METASGKKRSGNTAAAAKDRELAWEKIAVRVNACNPAGIKRMWQQIKMKYKNIMQSANRQKAEGRKTGGGPAPPPQTNADEMGLSLNAGRPMAEGIPGGTNSHGNICLLEPPVPIEPLAVDGGDEETVSADTERPTESVEEQPEEGPSTSGAQMNKLPDKELYRILLIKKIQKADLEMEILKEKLKDLVIVGQGAAPL
ncbi:uncharacterized protein LOC109952078 isoform X1, partial [Tachysurus ichikawai]